jgi:hypothetical protein
LLDFNFADASLVIGGSAIDMASFELTVDYASDVRFQSSFSPQNIITPQSNYSFSFAKDKDDDTFNAIERDPNQAGLVGQLIVKGTHDSTGAVGTDTVLTLDFANMSQGDISDDFPRGGIATQSVPYVLLPTVAVQDPVVYAFSEA